jgi:hypothetical protein
MNLPSSGAPALGSLPPLSRRVGLVEIFIGGAPEA